MEIAGPVSRTVFNLDKPLIYHDPDFGLSRVATIQDIVPRNRRLTSKGEIRICPLVSLTRGDRRDSLRSY
jgi:hypothetical protein